MRFRRALTLSLSVALLGVPALVATAGSASAAETYSTKLTIKPSYTKMQYKTSFSITGDLKAYDATGAEQDVTTSQTVTLERQDAGSGTWTVVGTDDTSGFYYFSDLVGAKNATYRVTFAGGTQYNYDTSTQDTTLTGSTASASVGVARKLGDQLVQKGNRLYLKGNVNPGWNNQVIHLQKRSCAKCAWRNVDKQRTTSTGGWRFQVGAPRTGKWYWRLYITGTSDYLKSWSDHSYYTYRF